MFISKKRYMKLVENINRLRDDYDDLYLKVRELDRQVYKNTQDIQNNVHYIAPPASKSPVSAQ